MPESEPKPKLIELVAPGAGQGSKAVLKNGRQVVVHEIPVAPAAAAAAVPRIQRLAEHPHPSLSPILAWGTDTAGLWVAVEPNEGTPLSTVLARGRFTPHAAAALGTSVLSGIAALHEAGVAMGGFDASAVRITANGDVRLAGHPVAAVRGAPSQSDLRADVRSCGMAICAAFGVDPAGAPAPPELPPGLVVTMRSMASGAMGPAVDRAQGALREMAGPLLAPDRHTAAQSELALRAGGREMPSITPFIPEAPKPVAPPMPDAPAPRAASYDPPPRPVTTYAPPATPQTSPPTPAPSTTPPVPAPGQPIPPAQPAAQLPVSWDVAQPAASAAPAAPAQPTSPPTPAAPAGASTFESRPPGSSSYPPLPVPPEPLPPPFVTNPPAAAPTPTHPPESAAPAPASYEPPARPASPPLSEPGPRRPAQWSPVETHEWTPGPAPIPESEWTGEATPVPAVAAAAPGEVAPPVERQVDFVPVVPVEVPPPAARITTPPRAPAPAPTRRPASRRPPSGSGMPSERPAWLVPAAIAVIILLILGTVLVIFLNRGKSTGQLARSSPSPTRSSPKATPSPSGTGLLPIPDYGPAANPPLTSVKFCTPSAPCVFGGGVPPAKDTNCTLGGPCHVDLAASWSGNTVNSLTLSIQFFDRCNNPNNTSTTVLQRTDQNVGRFRPTYDPAPPGGFPLALPSGVKAAVLVAIADNGTVKVASAPFTLGADSCAYPAQSLGRA